MKRKVLIISTRDLTSAPRVIRELQVLYENNYLIWTIGTRPAIQGDIQFISVSAIKKSLLEYFFNLMSKLFRIFPLINPLISRRYRKLYDYIASVKPDIVISHEPDFLPYLIKIRKTIPYRIVYNAHEYHPLEFTNNFLWNFFQRPYYEKIYKIGLPEIDLLINVCQSISEKCYSKYAKGIVTGKQIGRAHV